MTRGAEDPGATAYVVAVPPEPAAADLALLSADEAARAGRFRRAEDRAAFVTARAAARRHLAAALGVAPERVPIALDPRGRPRLAGAAPGGIDFNVSHSGAVAAVAVARGRPVGVDVEWRGAPRALAPLVADVMGRRERARLATLEGAALARGFHACWTRKEAIVKAMGVGLAYPVEAIDLPDLPPDGVVAAPTAEGGETRWTVRTVELAGGYTLSVAVGGAGVSIAIVAGSSSGVCSGAAVGLSSPPELDLYSSTPRPTIL